MGSERHDQVEDNFISLNEASEILELSDKEVAKLIQEQKLTAFQLGNEVIRLKKDQVWELESQKRISAELFPVDRAQHQNVPVNVKGTVADHVKDFFYFNDFYILSFVVITALLYLILSSNNDQNTI